MFNDGIRAKGLIRNLIGKQNLVGVEIGVAEGNNALHLLNNLKIKKLYLIDPYIPYIDMTQGEGLINLYVGMKDEAKQRLEGMPIKWIYKKSEDSAGDVGDIDFVYIDGGHEYEDVKKDIEIWAGKVKPGGTVAGHDYADGVKKAVDKYTEGKYKVTIDNDIEWNFIK